MALAPPLADSIRVSAAGIVTAGQAPGADGAGARLMRPVFVGGCERSGTTMLGALLGGHSRCICVPESHFIEDLLARNLDPATAGPRALLAGIVTHQRYRILWDLPLEPEAVEPAELGASFAEVLCWLVRAYARRHGKLEPHVWVDQTPGNFKRALTLLRMFPQARFIHIVRDGRGVAASVLPLDWGPNDVLHAAEFWMARCAAGFLAESQLGPERVQRVRYEDLLAQPEPTLRRLAAFAGLDYEPAMALGAGYAPARYNERQHRLVGRAPDKSRAQSWSSSLTDRQVEIFEAAAGEFLELLGYERTYGMRARRPKSLEAYRMAGARIVLRLRNMFRRRLRVRASLAGSTRH